MDLRDLNGGTSAAADLMAAGLMSAAADLTVAGLMSAAATSDLEQMVCDPRYRKGTMVLRSVRCYRSQYT